MASSSENLRQTLFLDDTPGFTVPTDTWKLEITRSDPNGQALEAVVTSTEPPAKRQATTGAAGPAAPVTMASPPRSCARGAAGRSASPPSPGPPAAGPAGGSGRAAPGGDVRAAPARGEKPVRTARTRAETFV